MSEGKIVITGICGRFGQLLALKLHREEEIIGLDRRPFPEKPKDIQHFQLDIRRKKCEGIFRNNKIKAVIHLGIMHDPRMDAEEHHTFNIMGTQSILNYCEKYNVPKIILLSSATIYGPRPDNTQFLKEDSPLLGGETFGDIRDLIAVDMLVNSFFWRYPSIETVILRPVHIIGRVKNASSNFLRLKTIPLVLGFDPMVQLIHEEDVARAIMLFLKPGVKGVFNIVGPSAIPLTTLLKQSGKKFFYIPSPLFKIIMKFMWKFRLTSFPAPELSYIMYHSVVDGSLAEKTVGFKPEKSLKDIINYVKELTMEE